ncbi:putative nucleosome remodeling complex ATPase subunit (Snf2h) [Aspergillus lucknowensis]|uniref:SNF2 family N-terminal domain-containing protein n=1 Tax=Aspergillus lucknowensis TaxID=176173 RepID=A0ABR4LG31_9EURO
MDSKYILSDSDSESSVPSSPRSFVHTPPLSPTTWPDSALTTPESSGPSYIHASRQILAPPNSRNLFLEPEPPKTQKEYLPDIRKRRSVFFATAKKAIEPLIGKDLAERLTVTAAFQDSQMKPHVLLNWQPKGLRAILKPYQLQGLSWLLYLKNNGMGGILGDDMGLGKTLQTLSLFQYMKDCAPYRDHKFLVVCPLSVLSTWLSEIGKWTTRLNPMAYHGSTEGRERLRERFRKGINQLIDIVVTSYETLCSDMFFFRAQLWTYIVLDEGHRIKNSQAKRTQGVYKLQSENKLVLTGTPIQNDLTELWSILHWLYPEVFVASTAQKFEEAFSLTDGKFDSGFLHDVSQFLNLIMLRRTKNSPEVAALSIPEKREIILSVPLTDIQLAWYYKILTGEEKSSLLSQSGDAVNRDDQPLLSPGSTQKIENLIDLAMDEWETGGVARSKKNNRITNNILMELRKCSIHPYLISDAMPDEYDVGEHVVETSGKYIVLRAMIHQFVAIEEKKVLIFSGFDQALNLCEDLLQLEKAHKPFRHLRLDGGTSSAWRNLSIFLFQSDPRYMVFLLSIRAGGEGLNLVGSSTVIFLDDDWNPQVMRQAESRVHRIGQTQPVQIFRLHARGTVEEQMRRRLSKKAYVADRVMEKPKGNSIDTPIDLDASDDQETPVKSRRVVSSDAQAAKELARSDFYGIMKACALDETSVQEMSQAEKRAWLERAERVKTDIFNGQKIDTSSRSFSVYEDTILNISKANRRIGKSRVVMVGEWEVSKDSLELAAKLKSPTSMKPKSKKNHEKVNEATCFLCRRPNPQECETCTRSFHGSCLDAQDDLHYTAKRSTIVCPHHHCCECGKPASQVGRLLFACLLCPKAYCENCLDWIGAKFVGDNPEAERRGYFTSLAFYVECAACRSVAKKRELDGIDLGTRKRLKRG